MTHQPHELSNLKIALGYFESLPVDDLSRRYAAGEKFSSGIVNRLKFFFSIDSVLSELNKFYPYQPIVKRTYEIYQEKKAASTKAAVAFSVLSMYLKDNLVLQSTSWPNKTTSSPSSRSSACSTRIVSSDSTSLWPSYPFYWLRATLATSSSTRLKSCGQCMLLDSTKGISQSIQQV